MAYGGFARKTVGRALDLLPSEREGGGGGRGGGCSGTRVEEYPDILAAALREASLLVSGLKQQHHPPY